MIHDLIDSFLFFSIIDVKKRQNLHSFFGQKFKIHNKNYIYFIHI